MKELEDIEIRSEEVQEILGTPPSWMVRWGSLTAFALFVVLMWLSFLVKYPDVVEADIRLVSKDPPVRITASNANRIDEVVIKNNTQVDSGQALIAFRSTANFRHVLTLEDYITALPSMRDEDLLKFKDEIENGDASKNIKKYNIIYGDFKTSLEAPLQYCISIYYILESDLKASNEVFQKVRNDILNIDH